MKKLIKNSTLILGLVIIVSCSSSPLDDVELQDVSLLTQEIIIKENRDYNIAVANNESSKKEVYVKIRDKNNRAVRLLDGTVSVQGQQCNYGKPDPLLTRDTYYVENFVPQNGDANYTVKVVLANGNTYNTTIAVPSFFDSNVQIDTMAHKIFWPASSNSDSLYLTISYEDETGMHNAYSPAASTPDIGVFDYTNIANQFPKIADNTYSKLTVKLWRRAEGVLPANGFKEDIVYKIEMTHNVSVFGNP